MIYLIQLIQIMDSGKQSVYLTIVGDIKRQVALGILKKGDRLPSCRELALERGINPNTVQRAYSELEAMGVIYTVPKKGVYVCEKKVSVAAVARERLAELKAGGLTKAELDGIIEELYGE